MKLGYDCVIIIIDKRRFCKLLINLLRRRWAFRAFLALILSKLTILGMDENKKMFFG